MNLTLRTLLARLDDTLPASEVREIARKLEESPYAKELVERIKRVSRSRRLAVPGAGGSDATDPNLVASYLDNELSQEQVAEFEKRCLTSDVHLAEVAGVHQILSMIGQRAKVPAEAKHRMYRLVKGREAIGDRNKRAANGDADHRGEPVTEPIAPWLPPELEPGKMSGSAAPIAAILGLLLVLAVSIWLSFAIDPGTNPSFQPFTRGSGGLALDSSKPKVEPESAVKPEPVSIRKKATEKSEEEKSREDLADEKVKADADKEATAKRQGPLVMVPPGFLATLEESDGVLFRYSTSKSEWERIPAKTSLRDKDLLVGLYPSRHVLQWGPTKVTLMGPLSARVMAADKDSIGRIQLVQGRLIVNGVVPPKPFSVRIGGETVDVTPPATSPVGLERIDSRESGVLVVSTRLSVYSVEGETKITHADQQATVSGAGVLQFVVPSGFTPVRPRPAPEWLTEGKLPPLEKKLSDDLAKLFRPETPIMASLAEAMDDPRKEIRTSAIQALGTLGELDLVVESMSKPNDPTARQAAIATLRAVIAISSASAKAVYDQLKQRYGDQGAATVEKLIQGFTLQEGKDPSTYSRLVTLLGDADVGIRELALGNLMFLTHRDAHGYKPDSPDGAGLQAWKDLNSRGELKAVVSGGE